MQASAECSVLTMKCRLNSEISFFLVSVCVEKKLHFCQMQT